MHPFSLAIGKTASVAALATAAWGLGATLMKPNLTVIEEREALASEPTPKAASPAAATSPEAVPPWEHVPVSSRVRWLGRVDTTHPDAPRFSWSYSGFAVRFSGSSLSVEMNNEGSYFFQAIVDGRMSRRFEASSGAAVYELAAGLPDGEHTVELRRETEGKYGASTLLAVRGSWLVPPRGSGRLIEVVGDSISAGYGDLGVEHHEAAQKDSCHFSFATESAFDAYPARAARALDADASVVALSGWGVIRDKDHGTAGTVPTVYTRSLADGASPAWASGPRAQAVIINLGMNDFTGPAPFDPGQASFTKAYLGLLADVRQHNPDAWVFCAVGPLLRDSDLPGARLHTTMKRYLRSIVSAAKARGDARVSLLELPAPEATVTGCDGHPNREQQEAMADVAARAIKDKLGW